MSKRDPMSKHNESARKPQAAEKKALVPPPKPVQEPVEPEQRRGWDGSIVIKEDIFGNKWASS